MNKKQVIRINENQIKRIVSESVKMVLKESEEETHDYINGLITKLLEMFPYVNNKITPFLVAKIKREDEELGEAVSLLSEISGIVYRLRNCDYVWRQNNNGETYDETHNRWQHEND